MKSNYFVVLKENQSFSVEIADKIRNMELKNYDDRFRFKSTESELIEVYFNGSEEECKDFIFNLDDDIKYLFNVKEILD